MTIGRPRIYETAAERRRAQHQQQAAWQRDYYARERAKLGHAVNSRWTTHNSVNIVHRQERPPPGVELERESALGAGPRSTTAAICGDPLPGRSALDRRPHG